MLKLNYYVITDKSRAEIFRCKTFKSAKEHMIDLLSEGADFDLTYEREEIESAYRVKFEVVCGGDILNIETLENSTRYFPTLELARQFVKTEIDNGTYADCLYDIENVVFANCLEDVVRGKAVAVSYEISEIDGDDILFVEGDFAKEIQE